jgi:hypothetical protein
MQRILLCLLSFVAMTTDAFMHAFLADDSAVFPVLPNSSGRFHLSRRALFADREQTSPRASASWSKLNNTPILSRITRNEVDTRRVENMLTDLISVLMHADDCTLLERQAQGMGSVYLDANFSMSRPPLLLRTGVREIMSRYNLPLRPVERKWSPSAYTNDNTTSIGI